MRTSHCCGRAPSLSAEEWPSTSAGSTDHDGKLARMPARCAAAYAHRMSPTTDLSASRSRVSGTGEKTDGAAATIERFGWPMVWVGDRQQKRTHCRLCAGGGGPSERKLSRVSTLRWQTVGGTDDEIARRGTMSARARLSR